MIKNNISLKYYLLFTVAILFLLTNKLQATNVKIINSPQPYFMDSVWLGV
jgi:hypothetical protein